MQREIPENFQTDTGEKETETAAGQKQGNMEEQPMRQMDGEAKETAEIEPFLTDNF